MPHNDPVRAYNIEPHYIRQLSGATLLKLYTEARMDQAADLGREANARYNTEQFRHLTAACVRYEEEILRRMK